MPAREVASSGTISNRAESCRSPQLARATASLTSAEDKPVLFRRRRGSDPISAYLAELRDLRLSAGAENSWEATRLPPEALDAPPTIHDLLRHSAGFTYWWIGLLGKQALLYLSVGAA